jgi:hypothetical protein
MCQTHRGGTSHPHSYAITRQLKDYTGGRIAAKQSGSPGGEYCHDS